ncbi:NAD(P)H-quinone oxidoreductase [Chitinimonas sp. BJB300]|uniref:NAD(P)H-quinone oxidoreductase n=1 Tax=Chitinimonas sp. BJB300 TaxID=1559339 RepID=UPI0018EC18CA|nr:NAD(P)H-quinone oxidoreductase [Chitinimonas sp. BJB300]
MMQAILQTQLGGVETLYLGEAAMPTPGPEQLLVRVWAAGVNRADIVQRQGKYPAPPGVSPLLGLEISGEVEAMGEAVEGFTLGDSVFGLVGGGGYAEFALLDASCASIKPDWLSHHEAASLPEAWMTAWFNLIELANLKVGERILIHAGASGVGAAAIQLSALHGAEVVCTVGSEDKADFCRRLGAHTAINYHEKDFTDAVKALGGANVILDCIGAAYLDRNLQCLQVDGRLVMIGLMGGANASLDLGRLLVKRLSLRGSTLRAQTESVKARLSVALREHVLLAIQAGQVQVTVDKIFPLAAVQTAHRFLEENHNRGKIILTLD